MSGHTKDEEKTNQVRKIEDVQIENLSLSEKIATEDSVKDDVFEEDTDIQIVNELSTMDDDPSLPCFTVRVLVTGVVSGLKSALY